MSDAAGISALGVAGLSEAFASGRATPSEALEVFASRIAALNPRLNAFLDLRLEDARREAEAATRRWRDGRACSPIDGIAYGVKANIAVSRLPWHAGIGAYREQRAQDDAAIVRRLSELGAVALGTLNMHEGALGATTDNPHFGRCANPWNTNLTPGGSSGGSGAAVAAGLCAFALGTDTMGSCRIPAAYCGVAGWKPSAGLVSRDGVIDLSPTLDHVGPLAASAADLLALFGALTGAASPAGAMRIGVADWGASVEVSDAVAAGFDVARAVLGGDAVRVDISAFEFGALRRCGLLVSEVEGHRLHEAALKRSPNEFSAEFRGMLEWGARQPAAKRETAYARVRDAGARYAALFREIDVLVSPTAPQGPFAFGDPVPVNQADFTALANFAGAPAVATPATSAGAPPASVQFVAAPGKDALALSAATAFERARGAAPRPAI